ncbi:MAG: CDC27 family protein [Campylobacter sp.]
MIDTNEILELEKKWQKYNKNRHFNAIKKIDKKFITVLSIIILTLVFIGAKNIWQINQKDEIASLKEQIKNTQKQYEKESSNALFYNDEAEQNNSTPQGWLFFHEIPSQMVTNKQNLQDQAGKYEEDQETTNIRETTKKLHISDVSLTSDELEDKFKDTNDTNVAITLAKRYFDKKEYKKSEKWALVANELDSQNEESWIIFARSKFRQNQKNEAIKILQTYNQTAKSTTIDEWIKKMKK